MITAAELMTREVLTVAPEMPVAEVAHLILEHRVSSLPVVDRDNHLVGVVGEDDLIRSAEAMRGAHRSWWLVLLASPKTDPADVIGAAGRTVQDVMSRDVLMASEKETLPHLIELLARPRIKRLPIVTDGKLMGIVSRVDILRYLAKNRQIRSMIEE